MSTAADEAWCGACLSRGRCLAPLGLVRSVHVQRALGEEVSNKGALSVCWECRTHVDKFLLFCERVQRVRSLLTSAIDEKQGFYSTLGKKTKIGFDIEFNVDDYTNLDPDIKDSFIYSNKLDPSLKIKQEIEKNTPQVEEDPGWEVPLLTSFKIELRELPESSVEVPERILETNLPTVHPNTPNNDVFEKSIKTENPDEFQNTSESEESVELEKRAVKRVSNNSLARRSVRPSELKGPSAVVDGVRTTLMSESERQEVEEQDRGSEQYARSLFRCETCLVGFLSAVFQEQHNEKNHEPAIGPYVCDICAVRFSTNERLSAHRVKHYQHFECSKCDFEHRNHTTVKKHFMDIHEIDKTFPCKKCDEVFAMYKEFRSHQIKVHLKKRTCPHCQRVFNSKTYNAHVKSHSENRGLPLLECAVCGKVLLGKFSLKSHMRSHAPRSAGDDAYCVECGMQFKDKYIYQQHLTHSLKHVSEEQMKHACNQCTKKFVTARELRNHHIVVHQKQLIKCDSCDKTYMTAYGLKLHLRKVHKVNDK